MVGIALSSVSSPALMLHAVSMQLLGRLLGAEVRCHGVDLVLLEAAWRSCSWESVIIIIINLCVYSWRLEIRKLRD